MSELPKKIHDNKNGLDYLGNNALLGLLRTLEGKQLITVFNFSRNEKQIDLPIACDALDLIAGNIVWQGEKVALPACGFGWFISDC